MEQEAKIENSGHDTSNKEEAFTHLAQGKRHLLVKDYSEAVTSLASACQLLAQLYGDVANECGEAYFNYGIALLELARTENGVLGIEGEGDESQDSDEGEEDGEDEREDQAESTEEKQIENGNHTEKESIENKEESSTESESKNNESRSANDDENEEKDTSKEDGEEDVSNLRLAWEMLELAKIIFKRQAEGNKQMHLKLAEVHLKLGEVGLESENYSQAIEDIKTCLEIQTQNLDKHDRCIAETHYQLGMAYSLLSEFDDSISQLNKAHELLEKRIEYLKEMGKQGKSIEQKESNPFYTIEGEIAEINAVLPDIKEKISDMEDFKNETKKALIAGFDTKKEPGRSSGSGEGSSSAETSGAFPVSSLSDTDAKPVSDISHLVRKKRKLEPDSSEENVQNLRWNEATIITMQII